MSDLPRLLAEEARRQTPHDVPPFERLRGRARWRNRRRRAASTMAVAAGLAAIVVGITATLARSDGSGTSTAKPTSKGGSPSELMLLPTDHWQPGEPSEDALLFGKLIIAQQRGSVCAWIGSRATAVLWPQGYRVRLRPADVIDAAGKVVARAGQTVTAGGGGMEATSAGPCNGLGQWTFSIQSEVRAGRAVTARPDHAG